MIGRRLLLVALFGLAACHPLTRPPSPQAMHPGPWAERKAELQSANHWRFDGRFAIAGAGSGGSAGIRWNQLDARAAVSVFGALGAGAMRIELDDEHLHVETGDGESFDGEAAAEALADRLGAPLPFAQLRYWLLGVAAPGPDATEVLGDNQRLATLTQQGWEIRYSEYQAVSGDLLPARVEASRGEVRVKLRISRWEWHRS